MKKLNAYREAKPNCFVGLKQWFPTVVRTISIDEKHYKSNYLKRNDKDFDAKDRIFRFLPFGKSVFANWQKQFWQ